MFGRTRRGSGRVAGALRLPGTDDILTTSPDAPILIANSAGEPKNHVYLRVDGCFE
jgi:hypothetical protein